MREFAGVDSLSVQNPDQPARVTRDVGLYIVARHHICFASVGGVLSSRHVRLAMHFDDVVSIEQRGQSGVTVTSTEEERTFHFPTPLTRDHALETSLVLWRASFEPDVDRRFMLPWFPEDDAARAAVMARLGGVRDRINSKRFELSRRDVRDLFGSARRVGLQRNMTVIKEGHEPIVDGLYILDEGRLRTQRRVGSHRVVLDKLEKGRIFGCDTFLTRTPPSCAVKVDSATAIIRYTPRAVVMEALRRNPMLAGRLYRYMALSFFGQCSDPAALSCRPFDDGTTDEGVGPSDAGGAPSGQCVIL